MVPLIFHLFQARIRRSTENVSRSTVSPVATSHNKVTSIAQLYFNEECFKVLMWWNHIFKNAKNQRMENKHGDPSAGVAVSAVSPSQRALRYARHSARHKHDLVGLPCWDVCVTNSHGTVPHIARGQFILFYLLYLIIYLLRSWSNPHDRAPWTPPWELSYYFSTCRPKVQ